MGVRIDANHFLTQPDANDAITRVFGENNRNVPNGAYISPRVGFSWLYGKSSQIPFADGFISGPRATIRGGAGVFQNMLGPDLADAGNCQHGTAGIRSADYLHRRGDPNCRLGSAEQQRRGCAKVNAVTDHRNRIREFVAQRNDVRAQLCTGEKYSLQPTVVRRSTGQTFFIFSKWTVLVQHAPERRARSQFPYRPTHSLHSRRKVVVPCTCCRPASIRHRGLSRRVMRECRRSSMQCSNFAPICIRKAANLRSAVTTHLFRHQVSLECFVQLSECESTISRIQ